MWAKILEILKKQIRTLSTKTAPQNAQKDSKTNLKFLKLFSKNPKSTNPTKSSDTFTSTIYKILLLYLGTSVCFLGIIFFMMYKRELHNLRAQQSIQMRNDFVQIATAMSQRGFVSQKGARKKEHKKQQKELKKAKKSSQNLASQNLPQNAFLQVPQSPQTSQTAQSPQLPQLPQPLQSPQNSHFSQAPQSLQTPHLSPSMPLQDSPLPPKTFPKSDEISPALLDFCAQMRSEIKSPFALLDENLGVVYSDLSVELESISDIFATRFLHFHQYIFVNFSRNKNMDFRHHFATSKLPKSVSKYLEKQGWIFVLQGEAIEISDMFGDENLFGKTFDKIFGKVFRDASRDFAEPKEIESIQKEILSIRVWIISFMLLSLSLIAIVAYALVRLSLRPLKAQIKHLERFIKDTTHEVNTPLSVILMSVQKFENENLSEANKKRLHHIKLSAQSLHQMYQNLIFLNFYEGKNATESIDIATLLGERVEYFHSLLAQKQITLKSNLALLESRKICIQANKDEIIIMLDNLLSNAIKYNHKGGKICINLHAQTAQNGKTNATLEIADNGYGIKAQDLEAIFERYQRCNDDKGGFGIGLSLVSEIARKYGIEICAKSKEGEGSTFLLSWSFGGFDTATQTSNNTKNIAT